MRGEGASMRNQDLHDALEAFAIDAADVLVADQRGGAELEFDLEDGGGRGPRLYHYRPLTARFILARWPRLRQLPSCAAAADALGAGSQRYLRVNGLRGEEAEPALQAMLERIYDDATDFHFPEQRFEAVYAEVETTLYESSQAATVLVAVHGLELHEPIVDLGDGLTLEHGENTDAPPEAVYGPADPAASGAEETPAAILSLHCSVSPAEPLPLDVARDRFSRLLTGLRLWKPGGISLAPVAWHRTGNGAWQPFEIESTGHARGEPWILVAGEQTELLNFLARIEGSTHGGSIAWALGRFEMGCGRRLEAEALSDYLLGLRALVEPGEGAGRSGLALRIAMLCADEGERRIVQRRLELAQALERFVMGERSGGDYLDAVGSDSPRTLVAEVERHLRSLLREVMGGRIDPDLRAVADEMLIDAVERRAPIAPPTQTPAPASPIITRAEPIVSELEEMEAADDEIDIGAQRFDGVGSPEYDWDDPDTYSAPV